MLIGLLGCGDSGPKRIAVEGTVTLDEQPVNDATIVFTPKAPGLAATAFIIDGKFSLSEQEGPTAGEHDVRINPNEAELEEVDPGELAQANRRPRIPKVYQQVGELSATVTGEPNQQFEFKLSTKP